MATITKEDFKTDITIVREKNGCGVRIDIGVEPELNDGQPFYKVINTRPKGFNSIVWAFTTEGAIEEYEKEVASNKKLEICG